jgi:hypothetical protein
MHMAISVIMRVVMRVIVGMARLMRLSVRVRMGLF